MKGTRDMTVKIEPRIRYTSGRGAWQGDKITTVDSREHAYLRVIGLRGYVTVHAASWPVARVYHISEIEHGHN
jgi:hypothetical protein